MQSIYYNHIQLIICINQIRGWLPKCIVQQGTSKYLLEREPEKTTLALHPRSVL